MSVDQSEKVLRYIQEYFACYQSYLLDASDQQLFRFTERWLDETFGCLGEHLQLYYRWAIGAQAQDTVSFYPRLDECLWELENRFAMLIEHGKPIQRKKVRLERDRFKAFLLSYNGESAAAAWAELGEFSKAAEQARLAGKLEQAHALLRRANETVPEELAIAVKMIRQMDQLQQKHEGLTEREKVTLYERFQTLQEILTTNEVREDEMWEVEKTDL